MGDLDDDGLVLGPVHPPAIPHQQALLDQALDQGTRVLGNLLPARDPSLALSRIGIDAGEPGDEGRPQEPIAVLRVARHDRRAIGHLERGGDRGLDRAAHASQRGVIAQAELVVLAVLEEQSLEREGEERHRVGPLRILEQLLGEPRIDLQRTSRGGRSRRGPFDDGLELAARNRRQAEEHALRPTEARLGLQPFVRIGSHGDDRDRPVRGRGGAELRIVRHEDAA